VRAPAGWAGLAAGLLGVLHAASFTPLDAWWLQLITLALALRLAIGVAAKPPLGTGRGWRDRAWTGPAVVLFAFGLGHYGAGLCWLHISMHRFGGMPWALAALAVLAFAAYLALFQAAAMALVGRPGAPGAPSPATDSRQPSASLPWTIGLTWTGATAGAWALADFSRGWLFTGFPWLSIGYAHTDGPLAGLAALAGVHGVGMAGAWVAALGALAMASRHWRDALRWTGVAALSLAAAAPLASLEFTAPAGAPVSVRLVQGNIAQQMKFDPQRAMGAMRAYAAHIVSSTAQLTVLPETAWVTPWASTPGSIREEITGALASRRSAAAIGVPLIDDTAGGPRITNSVVLLDGRPGGAVGARYDKHHLVPFGEFIPWGFEWFVRLMQIPLGNFARGSLGQAPFEVGGQRFAINICYEDLFGEEIIESVREPAGATVLVNVSNIAWFGQSHALGQHLAIARMRTLETGRPMLRATNTGVTASIDHRARVLAQLPEHQEGVLDIRVQGTTGLTPYVRAGNLPVILLALLLLIIARTTGRRRSVIQ
jgi:apolipoprotein N-acyltransferase